MGIVNVTPDSFSDGGRYADPARAIAHGLALVAEGADLVDVGGESTRPGAEPVSVDDELARVVPVVEGLAGRARVSVDTAKPEVARAAVAAGASVINDVTASLAPVAAEVGAGWIAMHMQGTPRTMQADPTYGDVVAEVEAHLLACAARAAELGVGEVWIDPGIGFGKRAEHNWALLAALPRLVASGVPVAVGTSRKAFLGAALGRADGAEGPTPVDDRLEGSVATAVAAAADGVALVRVHDVAATVAALEAAGLRAPGGPSASGRRGAEIEDDERATEAAPDRRETTRWP
jgi:dihydropteroate synthase